MIFNKVRDYSIKFKVKGEKIKNVKFAKFLGIYFDDKLNFEKKLKEIQGKVNKALNIFKYIKIYE